MGLLDRAQQSGYYTRREEERRPSLLERARAQQSVQQEEEPEAEAPAFSSLVSGINRATIPGTSVPMFATGPAMAATVEDASQRVAQSPFGGALGAIDRGLGRATTAVLDTLQRGTYAGAKYVDTVADERRRNENRSIVERGVANFASSFLALREAVREGIVPQERLTMSKVIREHDPEFAESHPALTETLGFIGDVAVDPTTYLGLGQVNAVRRMTVAGVVGLSRPALRKAAVEAGVRVPMIERLGQLVGKPSASAERALAAESSRAVETFYQAERKRILRELELKTKQLSNQRKWQVQDALNAQRQRQAQGLEPGPLVDEGVFQQQLSALAQWRQQRVADAMVPGTTRAPKSGSLLDKSAFDRALAEIEKVRFKIGPDEYERRMSALTATRSQQAREEALSNLLPPDHPPMEAIESAYQRKVAELTAERTRQVKVYEQGRANNTKLFPFSLYDAPEDFVPGKLVTREGFGEAYEQLRAGVDTQLTQLGLARKALEGQVFTNGEELTDALGRMLGYKTDTAVVWDTAEARLTRMLNNPEMVAKLRDKGGVKIAGRTVIDQETINQAAKLTGVSRVFDRVADMKKKLPLWLRSRDAPIAEVQREVELPDGTRGTVGQLYLAARRVYESTLSAAPHRAWREFVDHWSKLSKDESEKLGRLMWDLDDIASGRGAGEGLDEAGRQVEMARRLSDAKLEPRQHAAYAHYRQRMAEIAAYEKELGLLEHLHENYFHRIFDPKFRADEAESAEFFMRMLGDDRAKIPGAELDAAKARLIVSREQAEKLGYEYSFDAAASYTLRVVQHERAVSRKIFENRLKLLFPDSTVSPDGVVLKGLPKPIAADLRFMGEGTYPKDMIGGSDAWRAFDHAQGWFKKLATVWRPSFAARQSVSNTVQLALVQGMGALDPRSAWEAFNLIRYRHAPGADEALRDKFGLRTALGGRLSGAQLLDEMEQHGILRGVTVEGIGPGNNPRYTQAFMERLDTYRAVNQGWGSDNAAGRGMKKFISGSLKYTNIPAHIEDFARATGYINARRMGHLPDDAAQLVNKALFDYMHGLSQFEQRWVKRLVPFYSYQRFAIPMMAKVFASTPGRVTNLAKGSEAFFRVWDKISSNDELTQEEREVLPGWLLEQPRAFHGFTELMRAEFKTFNNYSPLDVMGFVAAHGEGDERGMLTKFGLAQITPFVKVPIELMMGRDAFTGRKMDDRKRDVGPINPDEFVMETAGAVLAGITGRPEMLGMVMAGAGGLSPGSPEFNRKVLALTLGYEEGINKTTGERTAYMNPYRVHILTSFAPGLNEIFKLSREDRTPLQKTMYGLFGIGTVELDLQQEQERRALDLEGRADVNPPPRNSLKGLEYRVKWAEERELHDQAQRYREELNEFLERMEDRSMELEGHVRGGYP